MYSDHAWLDVQRIYTNAEKSVTFYIREDNRTSNSLIEHKVGLLMSTSGEERKFPYKGRDNCNFMDCSIMTGMGIQHHTMFYALILQRATLFYSSCYKASVFCFVLCVLIPVFFYITVQLSLIIVQNSIFLTGVKNSFYYF